MSSEVFRIADEFVANLIASDPMTAHSLGVPAEGLSRFDAETGEQNAALMRQALADLAQVADQDDSDRIARAVMTERLNTRLAMHAAGDYLVSMDILMCPMVRVRQIFDLLPTTTAEQQQRFLSAAADIPAAIESYQRGLEQGLARGLAAARRQVGHVSRQAQVYAESGFLADRLQALGAGPELNAAIGKAFADFGKWLDEVYLPQARTEDGVGSDRYRRGMRQWNGIDIDPLELWAWGWEELDRITVRMERVRDKVAPGRPLAEVAGVLSNDPRYEVHGHAEILALLRDLIDRTTEEMVEHFDIDERIRFCDVQIAPAGSASAAYYMRPSEDFTRPGTSWLPDVENGRFHMWQLVSTWYHEAVPGHHLQLATAMLSPTQSRFQRTLGGTSGFSEGWALYAERLMDELGYFADPGHEMGFLSAQALRAARIVVDIGMHLGLSVPEGQAGELAGALIDHDFSVDFLQRRALQSPAAAASETVRYLGIPGQAISYKLGERTLLQLREQAKQEAGSEFDLKAWHAWLLGLGAVPLETLFELARPNAAG